MNTLRKFRLLACLLSFLTAFYPLAALADDIDIFVGSSAGIAANPNVLIVLDNTSNWARQSQQWPGGLQQGQSEANAIKTVISGLGATVNVGLLEFVTGGTANDDGGFVRSSIQPLTAANKAAFSSKLTTIYGNVTGTDEKRNSNTPYGNLMYDVYNYFAGANVSQDGGNNTRGVNPPNPDADAAGYTAPYTVFRAPLSSANSCARNFQIFIGNPNASGPASDSSDNTAALAALGCNTSPLALPTIGSVPTTQTDTLGNTGTCYASLAAAQSAYGYGVNSSDNISQLYVNNATATDYQAQCASYTQGCLIGAAASTTNPMACPAGTNSYHVVRTATSTNVSGPTAQAAVQTSAVSSTCYATAALAAAGVAAGDRAGLSCPAATSVQTTVGGVTTTVATTHACTYALGAVSAACSGASNLTDSNGTSACYASLAAVSASDAGGLTCPSGYNCSYAASNSPVACAAGSNLTATGTTGYLAAAPAATAAGAGAAAGLSCPANYTCSYGVAVAATASGGITPQSATSAACYWDGSGTQPPGFSTWTSATGDHAGLTCPANYSCIYTAVNNNAAGCGTSHTMTQTVTQTATAMKTYSITQTASPLATYRYPITQTAVPATPSKYTVIQTDTPTVTTTTTSVGATDLGQTSGCYAGAPASTSDYADQCSGVGVSCSYNTNPAATTNHCATGSSQYLVQGTNLTTTNGPTGNSSTDTSNLNADEWARCMYQRGIPVTGGANQNVTTYTIDVYNKQPNSVQTSLLLSMATNGGGKYFSASSEAAIATALKQIMAEIQSINSTFASASLPINATNRAQNENQVFIGMFRPDPDAKPRWFGNVKRYQLVKDVSGAIQLGDANGALAINNNTGFVTDCATSWWTTDSSSYWQNYLINPNPAGTCPTTAFSAYSDSPDGPRVEKGAVAEIVRRGNNPPNASTTVNRTLYSASGASLVAFSAATAGLSATTANWVRGQDTEGEDSSQGASASTRASLHGDVVHSRPLPVNYCTSANCTNVVVYYGANDGTLRAVDAATGKEKWAFVATEFGASRFERLRTQTPLVNYPNVDPALGPLPRDYFWDGSIGLYQTADNGAVWIYPTMRRGGRMIYGLDVTDANAPSIKWKLGCPNLSDDSDCSAGASAIGQTWSLPNVAFIKGYSTATPALVVGGGYDGCEDANNVIAGGCNSTKGNVVYVINADSGAIIKSFSTLRSVVGDVAMIDMDYDGYPDYAYFGDSGGNLYRISFSSYNSATGKYQALGSADWVINRIAYTAGAGRKFQFAPALFGGAGTVYLALGSGDREHPLQSQYPYTTPVTNRFYVYRDCLAAAPASSSLAAGDNLDDASKMNNETVNPSCNAQQTTPANCAGNKGWFTDLAAGTGEQTVTSAVISGGMVTFSTNRPIAAAAGTCSTALGEARGYWLNLYNGSGAVGVTGNCGGEKSALFVGGGLPPSPIIGTVPINGVPTSVVIGAVQRTGIASSPISPQRASPTNLPARKRVYSFTKGE